MSSRIQELMHFVVHLRNKGISIDYMGKTLDKLQADQPDPMIKIIKEFVEATDEQT